MEFENPTETHFLKGIIYGRPGSGKTVMLPTMVGETLILNVEGGLLSIRDKLTEGTVKSVAVNTAQDIRNVSMELKTEDHTFKTVAIDSLTEVQKLVMVEIMAGQTDKDVPAMRDWYKCTEEMRGMIRFFRDLPMHVFFTCLPREDKDEQYGNIISRPSLSGKLADDACGYVDLVLYLLVKEEEGELNRYCLTQPTDRFYAKDRSGKLDRFESPDLAAMYYKIFDQGGKE